MKWRGYRHGTNPKRRIAFMVDLSSGPRRSLLLRPTVTDPMADGSTATIGIQEGGATGEFAQFSHNQATLSTALGVLFEPTVPTNTAYPSDREHRGGADPERDHRDLGASRRQDLQLPVGAVPGCRCATWSNITGATNATYTLQAADRDMYVFAAVKAATDGVGPTVGFSYPAWVPSRRRNR